MLPSCMAHRLHSQTVWGAGRSKPAATEPSPTPALALAREDGVGQAVARLEGDYHRERRRSWARGSPVPHWRWPQDQLLARPMAWRPHHSPAQRAPNLLTFVRPACKLLSVADALPGHAWVDAIRGTPSVPAIAEFLTIWEELRHVSHSNTPDSFSWRFGTAGKYSSRDTYATFFFGREFAPCADEIWRSWAPLEDKNLHLAGDACKTMDGGQIGAPEPTTHTAMSSLLPGR